MYRITPRIKPCLHYISSIGEGILGSGIVELLPSPVQLDWYAVNYLRLVRITQYDWFYCLAQERWLLHFSCFRNDKIPLLSLYIDSGFD